MILGAGSSIAEGMPSVPAIDDLMKKWSAEWADSTKSRNYFDLIWKAVECYYSAEKPALRPILNFEKILGDMLALANWMTPAPYGNSLRQITCDNAAPHSKVASIDGYGSSASINSQVTYLLRCLATHMRDHSRRLDLTTKDFIRYQNLISDIRNTFDLGIYNLNYDNVALSAWRDAFTGFERSGDFDPGAVHGRREWGFLYHLHGSVHHTLVGPFGDSILWQVDLAAQFDDGQEGRAPDKRSDSKSLPKTTLVAGGFKLDQLLIEPFQSFYASLIRHVYEADAFVIGGYGFGDIHVNRALQNRFFDRSHARPPVLVLTKSKPLTDPMLFRNDTWSWELCGTLNANTHYFVEPGHTSAPRISALIKSKSFEVESRSRVAIWHSGFNEAIDRLDCILPWLAGKAADSVLGPPSSSSAT